MATQKCECFLYCFQQINYTVTTRDPRDTRDLCPVGQTKLNIHQVLVTFGQSLPSLTTLIYKSTNNYTVFSLFSPQLSALYCCRSMACMCIYNAYICIYILLVDLTDMLNLDADTHFCYLLFFYATKLIDTQRWCTVLSASTPLKFCILFFRSASTYLVQLLQHLIYHSICRILERRTAVCERKYKIILFSPVCISLHSGIWALRRDWVFDYLWHDTYAQHRVLQGATCAI